MSTMIQAADQYIQAHQHQVNPRYLPRLHAHPPIGWLNDPNGLCYFHGEYHLYAQYYPYSASWNSMHWAHWTSNNLVEWTWQGVALAPDMPYDDCGCFSGHAMVVKNRLYIMYTGVSQTADGNEVQQQCVAMSDDGYHFTKYQGNPVITSSMLPDDCDPQNFRDPKVLHDQAGYHVLLAAKGPDGGRLLLYRSNDMLSWQFERTVVSGQGSMLECPDAFTLDGHDITVACVMDMKCDGLRYPNEQPAVYALDTSQDVRWETVDFGFDFYAPQTLATSDGRRVMIGWMNGWKHDFPPRFLGDGWNGAMTLPRELSVSNGRLRQRPVKELEAYRGSEWTLHGTQIGGAQPLCSEMQWQIDLRTAKEIRLQLMRTAGECFQITYRVKEQVLSLDRSRAGQPMGTDGTPEAQPVQEALLPVPAGQLALRIFRDNTAVEIFAGDGEVVLSTWIFPLRAADRFTAESDDGSACFDLHMWPLMDKPLR